MNVTVHFQRYKEAARNLWNTYFFNNGSVNWDDHEIFGEIDKMLFGKIVLDEIAETKTLAYDVAITMFRIRSVNDGLSIIVNRTGDGGYWDHPVTALVHDEYEIQFESYFDWDDLGIKDYRYMKSRILNSKKHQEIIGHKALIESQHVEVHLISLA